MGDAHGYTGPVRQAQHIAAVLVNVAVDHCVRAVLTQDAPGWYAESGVHMFFATRYSVIIGAVYRSAQIRNMIDAQSGFLAFGTNGKPFRLDMSGVGAKMAVSIGL